MLLLESGRHEADAAVCRRLLELHISGPSEPLALSLDLDDSVYVEHIAEESLYAPFGKQASPKARAVALASAPVTPTSSPSTSTRFATPPQSPTRLNLGTAKPANGSLSPYRAGLKPAEGDPLTGSPPSRSPKSKGDSKGKRAGLLGPSNLKHAGKRSPGARTEGGSAAGSLTSWLESQEGGLEASTSGQPAAQWDDGEGLQRKTSSSPLLPSHGDSSSSSGGGAELQLHELQDTGSPFRALARKSKTRVMRRSTHSSAEGSYHGLALNVTSLMPPTEASRADSGKGLMPCTVSLVAVLLPYWQSQGNSDAESYAERRLWDEGSNRQHWLSLLPLEPLRSSSSDDSSGKAMSSNAPGCCGVQGMCRSGYAVALPLSQQFASDCQASCGSVLNACCGSGLANRLSKVFAWACVFPLSCPCFFICGCCGDSRAEQRQSEEAWEI